MFVIKKCRAHFNKNNVYHTVTMNKWKKSIGTIHKLFCEVYLENISHQGTTRLCLCLWIVMFITVVCYINCLQEKFSPEIKT